MLLFQGYVPVFRQWLKSLQIKSIFVCDRDLSISLHIMSSEALFPFFNVARAAEISSVYSIHYTVSYVCILDITPETNPRCLVVGVINILRHKPIR